MAARLLRGVLALTAAFYGFVVLSLFALRYIDPPFTGVHVQRRIESLVKRMEHHKRYQPVPLSRISPHLQHAAIAAEDGRFFQHSGFDWAEIKAVIDDELEKSRLRGASTITQQLVKNLYFTTHGLAVRKGLEASIVPLAEWILGKERILELYLNVIEWGPGVFGADAAARHHYRVPASQLTREQSARLAAILPNPLRRRPARMDQYTAIILERMAKMGW